MKVCHITSVHPRYDTRILYKECVTLRKAGHDVTLLVLDTNMDEEINRVKIQSAGAHLKTRGERFFKTKKKMLSAAISLGAEVYHLHDPELLPVGRKLKKLGKKVIFDSHEDVPNDIMDKTWIPLIIRRPVSFMYRIYEKLSLKKLDAVISVTPHLTERLKEINKNTIQITNYPILKASKENKSKEITICFAGGISEQWNHKKIIKVLKDLKIVRYSLAGRGENRYIEELQSMDGWKYVDYFGHITYEEVWELYCKSSIGVALLNYSNNTGRKIGTLGNTKLFEYMMAGLPVICTDFTLWREIIDKYKCGIYIDPNNENDIAQAIKYLIDNPEICFDMGRNGRRAVIEQYNWSTQEKVLIDLYKSL